MAEVQTFLTLTTQSLFAPSQEWQDAAGEIVDRLKNAFGRDGRKTCEIVGAGFAQTAGGARWRRMQIDVGGIAKRMGGGASAVHDHGGTIDCAGEVGEEPFEPDEEERVGLYGGGFAQSGASAQVKGDTGKSRVACRTKLNEGKVVGKQPRKGCKTISAPLFGDVGDGGGET